MESIWTFSSGRHMQFVLNWNEVNTQHTHFKQQYSQRRLHWLGIVGYLPYVWGVGSTFMEKLADDIRITARGIPVLVGSAADWDSRSRTQRSVGPAPRAHLWAWSSPCWPLSSALSTPSHKPPSWRPRNSESATFSQFPPRTALVLAVSWPSAILSNRWLISPV